MLFLSTGLETGRHLSRGSGIGIIMKGRLFRVVAIVFVGVTALGLIGNQQELVHGFSSVLSAINHCLQSGVKTTA